MESTVPKVTKKGPKSTNKKNQKPILSDEDKIAFAHLVELYPALWNITDENYKKRDHHALCWDKVSKECGIGVADCKATWKSLRDALKYRQKAKKFKSGDSGDENFSDDDDNTNDSQIQNSLEAWPFWECLKFLEDSKPQRKTLSTIINSQVETEHHENKVTENDPSNFELDSSSNSLPGYDNRNDIEDEETVPKPKPEATIPTVDKAAIHFKRTVSNYDYASGKRFKPQTTDADTKVIADSISQLVELRKKSSEAALSQQKQDLKYMSMYINLDRMLQKLPASIVEDLNMQFINLAYNEVKKYENGVFVEVTHPPT